MDEEEPECSDVGPTPSLGECLMSTPCHARLAAVALPASIMLMERWARKLALAQGWEFATWESRGLSSCSPHWPEAMKTLSEGSLEGDEREEELLLRDWLPLPDALIARLRDGSALLWSLKSKFSNCLHITSSSSVNWLIG